MSHIQQYWEEVTKDFCQQRGVSALNELKRRDIKLFLFQMKEKLEFICKKSEKKALLCGLKKVQHVGFVYDQLEVRYHTFRRIFLTKETANSSAATQERFAIYLGYESMADYLEKKGIIQSIPSVEQQQTKQTPQIKATRPHNSSKKAILFGLLLVLLSILTCFVIYEYGSKRSLEKASNTIAQPSTADSISKRDTQKQTIVEKEKPSVKTAPKINYQTIKAFVLDDQTGVPLSHVKISTPNQKTQTDANGFFQLRLPTEELESQRIKFEKTGYQTKEPYLNASTPNKNIKLKRNEK
ncbi:MAG: hypothetical protein AAFP19_01850 [Bacteroidota bacterium]